MKPVHASEQVAIIIVIKMLLLYYYNTTKHQIIQTNKAPSAGIDGISPTVLVSFIPFVGYNMSPVYKQHFNWSDLITMLYLLYHSNS